MGYSRNFALNTAFLFFLFLPVHAINMMKELKSFPLKLKAKLLTGATGFMKMRSLVIASSKLQKGLQPFLETWAISPKLMLPRLVLLRS
jgi:hypothetical protein